LITAVAPALLALLHVHFREAGLAHETLAFVVQGLADWTPARLRHSLYHALFSTEARVRKRAAEARGCLAAGLFYGHPVAFDALDFDTACLGFSANLNPTRTAHATAIVGNQLADNKTLRHLRAVLEPDGSFVIWGSFGDDAESVVDMPPALPTPKADDDDDSLSSDYDSDSD
jgi:hypothetical protein